MEYTPAPTDQRAGVRPIAFVMQKWGGDFYSPVTLKIRPTDLTKNEPSRSSVTQTLGKEISGWNDNFGKGLPTCTIAGHTGWRQSQATGLDGVMAFHQLNQLIAHEYHEAKQDAINHGADPDLVKLIFVDMLDDFCWSVVPMSFVLQRSKSQPLLMKYNIQLQAISTDVENPLRLVPEFGSFTTGIAALDAVLSKLRDFKEQVGAWVEAALAKKDALLKPIASTIKAFTTLSVAVLDTVGSSVTSIKSLIGGTANSLIGMAKDVATVGVNIFRTIASIQSLDPYLRTALSRVASAYNEVICIFSNSLRARKTYEEYEGLYGSSNCSSTTGGRPPSDLELSNAFEMMEEERPPVYASSAAQSSIASISRSDPVLRPMSIQEIGRNLQVINSGLKVAA